MIQLREIGILKWIADFGGNPPTIDRDTNGTNKGARVGDIAIDISVTPNKQWVCVDNTPGAPVWVIRFSNTIEFAPGDVLLQGDLIIADGYGIKSQNYQTKFLPQGTEYWITQSDLGMKFTNLSGSETRGYIHTSGTEIGFLDSYGQWAVRVEEGQGVELRYNNLIKFTTSPLGAEVTGFLGINQNPLGHLHIAGDLNSVVVLEDKSKSANHKNWVITNISENLDVYPANDDLSGNPTFRFTRSGQFIPGIDDNYSIGSPTYRWNNLYTNNIWFENNSKIITSDNFEFFKDSSYYWNLKSTGGLRFYDTSNNLEFNIIHTASNEFGITDADDDWAIRIEKDGSVGLYYNGDLKLSTNNNGISINGNFNFTGWLELTGDVGIYNNTYDTRIYNQNNADYWYITSNQGIELQNVILNTEGYLTFDGSHNIGIKDRHGNWGIVVQDQGNVNLYTSSDNQIKAYTFDGGFCTYTSLTVRPYTGGSPYSLYNTESHQTLVNGLDVGQFKTEFVSYNSNSSLGGFDWYKATAPTVYDKLMSLSPIGRLWVKEDLTFNINNFASIGNYASNPNYITTRSNAGLNLQDLSGTDRFYLEFNGSNNILFKNNSGSTIATFYNNGNFAVSGQPYAYNNQKIWHEGNDGHTSGLDADTVDGHHGDDLASGISENQPAVDDIAVGWYTIAVSNGYNASAKFSIKNHDQNHYQCVTFYASVQQNSGAEINVLSNSLFDQTQCNITDIRIKVGSNPTDGALLQVHIDNADNKLTSYIFHNFATNGWILKNWVPDGTDPGDVPNFSNITIVATDIDLKNHLQHGGMTVNGDLFVTRNIWGRHTSPLTNDTYDLGSSSYIWRNVYTNHIKNSNGHNSLESFTNETYLFAHDNWRLRLYDNGSGTHYIYVRTDFLPSANYTYDLGSSSYTWKNVYTGAVKNSAGYNALSSSDQSTYLYAHDNWRLRLYDNGSGTHHIHVNSKIIPYVNNNFSLGDSDHRWQYLYANKIHAGITAYDDNAYINVCCNDSHLASINAYGHSNGTGLLFVGQNANSGGGIVYNGGNYYLTWADQDYIVFYRRNGGVNHSVFKYSQNSSNVYFYNNVSPHIPSGSYHGSLGDSSHVWENLFIKNVYNHYAHLIIENHHESYETLSLRDPENNVRCLSIYDQKIWSLTHFYPGSDNAYDLGSTNYTWRNIYVSNIKNNIGYSTLTSDGDNTYLYAHDNWRLRLYDNGSGTHHIYVRTHLYPYSDNTYNLGDSSHRWKNLYVVTIQNKTSNNVDFKSTILPSSDDTYYCGLGDYRWKCVFTNDLNVSDYGEINELQVYGHINVNNVLARDGLRIMYADTTNDIVYFYGCNSSGQWAFYLNDDKMYSKNLYPTAANAYSLGSSSLYWSSLYAYNLRFNDFYTIDGHILACVNTVTKNWYFQTCNQSGNIGDTYCFMINANNVFVSRTGIYPSSPGNVHIGSSGEYFGESFATKWTDTSSIRYKTDIEYDNIDTSKLYNLKPVTFYFKTQNKEKDPYKHIGFIAEEMFEQYPEVVALNDKKEPVGIRYTSLIPLLVKEIQNLNERIKKLEANQK